ncbi:hypothetical protein PG985_000991 [Apiospora marii]|uniref:uncharacterized protein n=1 Tax=Apiospora marii TaxID=335849 RepID=UPI003131F741
MSDAGGNPASNSNDSPAAAKPGAPKDRSCPYCAQPFTSSSLGRHLDLYIKERNPKPPDGLHDVDAIRKMRGTITRRQPRGSLARRDASTPTTPTGSTATAPGKSSAHEANPQRPSIPKEGQYFVDQAPKWPLPPSWEATGVMNDLPPRNGDFQVGSQWDEADPTRRQSLQPQRVPSRAAQKQQLDARQKLTDAVDTARAAELALREMLSSWRAAKQHIDMNSVPFDFDPLALDFPALTLQCLQAPPTLFSSTPHPTSTSWSIQPPAQKQFDALKTWFQEEFRKWKVACAAATTASSDDLTYPPSQTHAPLDLRESVKKAEKAAANLEKQVNEHLQSTYAVWEQLPPQRRSELWTLELARSVGRRQKEVDKFKESQHYLRQESVNLKSQIDQLNHLQQPREFRVMPPATVPFNPSIVSYCLEFGMKGPQSVGLNLDDRHVDLTTLVSRAIERWKNVIVSSRGSGMSSQRPLEQPTPTPAAAHTATPDSPVIAQPKPAATSLQAQPRHAVAAPGTTPSNDVRANTTPTTTASASAASVANDDNSDQDADAEMEEDDFPMNTSTPVVAKPLQQQQQQQLEVPRTRRLGGGNEGRFTVDGLATQTADMGRSLQTLNNSAQGGNQRARNTTNKTGYSAPVQSVGAGGGDPMYMD